VLKLVKEYLDEFYPEPVYKEEAAGGPDADGWEKLYDEQSGAYYWYNHNTGEMQWEE